MSSDRRFACDQQILARERDIDELSDEHRRLLDMLEVFSGDMRRGFERLQELNAELVSGGAGLAARWRLEVEQERQREVRLLVELQREDVESAYRQARLSLESDIEDVQRARGGLPWD